MNSIAIPYPYRVTLVIPSYINSLKKIVKLFYFVAIRITTGVRSKSSIREIKEVFMKKKKNFVKIFSTEQSVLYQHT